jgi:hypothetical protein
LREEVQRRGVHVNTLKIGSRGDAFCIGGILGFYADLRRESDRGNFTFVVFGFLGVGPRRSFVEGGQLVFLLGVLGGILVI